MHRLAMQASSDATYPIPVPSGQGRDELIGWAAAFVRREIDQDRKSTALKTLQVFALRACKTVRTCKLDMVLPVLHSEIRVV